MTLKPEYFGLVGAMLLAGGMPQTLQAESSLPTGKIDLDDTNEILLTIRGVEDGGRLGQGLAGGRDFNGDGFDDFAIAAPGIGKVYLIYGGRDDLFPLDKDANVDDIADVILSMPEASGDDEHASLSFSDLDDDGFADLVVGSPWYDASSIDLDRGRVWVLYGAPVVDDTIDLEDPAQNAVLTISNNGNDYGYLGNSVSGGRDATGNRVEDLMVGAPGLNKAYLIQGRETSQRLVGEVVIGDIAKLIYSGGVGEQFGQFVLLSPTLNNTYSTMMIGAPGTTSEAGVVDCGALYLKARTQNPEEYVEEEYTASCSYGSDDFRLGTMAIGASNHSGNGYNDLFIAGPGVNAQPQGGSGSDQILNTGSIFFRYSSGGWPAVSIGYASNAKPYVYGLENERLGQVGIAGDLDNDGRDDLIFGSPGAASWEDEGGALVNAPGGRVSIMLTGDDDVLGDDERRSIVDMQSGVTDGIFFGEGADDRAGEALAIAGNLFHGDSPALLIGAPGTTTKRGRVYLYHPYDGQDADEDGVEIANGDCDDANALIHSSFDEVCDGFDNDCDGAIDEGVTTLWYADSDGDSYGTEHQNLEACEQPDGYVDNADDCYDGSDATYPGATEVCDDNDNDCDDSADEDLEVTWYRDQDEDGYGDEYDEMESCTQPAGYVANDDDCNDDDPNLNPETIWYLDFDEDGVGGDIVEQDCDPGIKYVQNTGDCDDGNADRFPDNSEVCDGVDNDCDEIVPSDEIDDDGDRFMECEGDCDDTNIAISPTATEVCDEQDNDCDEGVDEGVLTEYYLDSDSDGYGAAAQTTQACFLPDGYAENSEDCDDLKSTTYPGADEICDGDDNDCNGDTPSTEANADGDDYRFCEGDCDDSDAVVFPGANEICDGKDTNCDGIGDDMIFDGDEDGHVDDSAGCTLAVIGGKKVDDCDDTDPHTYLGAPEICDDIDNDCDGTFEDEKGDSDRDGFSPCPENGDESTVDCDDSDTGADVYPGAPELCDGKLNDCNGILSQDEEDLDDDGFIQCSTCASSVDCGDCDDERDDIYPDAAEDCDLADNDCDSSTDEGVLITFYIDEDGDGSGSADTTAQACTAPDGYVENDLDCDDSDGTIFEGLQESCDVKDNDCDGIIDETFEDADLIGGADCSDADGDGDTEAQGDCDDEDASIYVGAPELESNGIDNDCDGEIDEDADLDGDGFLPVENGGTDCNDDPDNAGADSYPGAPELCSDSVDNNCDGLVNEVCREPGFFAACSSTGRGEGSPWALILMALPILMRQRRVIR